MKTITVVPAYGRDYKTAKAASADWAQGKDFLVSNVFDPADGKPINLEDAQNAGLDQVTIRFHACAKLCVVKVKAATRSVEIVNDEPRHVDRREP